MTWLPIIALPNINVRCEVESKYAAIAGRGDDRVVQLCKEHPELRKFLDSFRDAFKRRHPVSLVLLREGAPETYRHARSIAGFRDLLALSTIPLNRASTILAGRSMYTPIFSNSFDFYPWMLANDYRWMTAMTPAISALDELQDFAGHSNPEISHLSLEDLDEPLFAKLIECWERCFATLEPEWKDRALFRSLNMATQATRTPFTIAGTFYDTGRLIALWISAFEILVHPGGKEKANKDVVTRVLVGLPDSVAITPQKTYWVNTLREWALKHVYKARDDYLHGNPVADDRHLLPNTKADLNFYASLIYRLILTEFLGLHYQMPSVPADTPNRDAVFVEAVMSGYTFENYQNKIEEALFTMTGHRRMYRRSPPGMYRS